jgi:sugar phosphate isomerase/epimerase
MTNTQHQVRAAAAQGWPEMPRIAMNEMTTYHWSLLEDVTGYQAAGIESIGVWRRKLCDFGEERGIELLRESGLAVSSFSSAGGFTGSDGQTFREAVDDALDAVRVAAEIRAGCLVVVTGGRAGHTLNHARRLLRDALWELGDAAGRSGISIALQPVHRRPIERWSFLTTLDATLDMLDWCDHPRVGMVFDFFHVWREPDLCRRIPEFLPWVRLAALCDARPPARNDDDRCVPGRGQLPVGEIVSALEAGGYRGVYDVQLMSDHCWKSDYAALLAECREALTRVCPEALAGNERIPTESDRLPEAAPAQATIAVPPL